MHTDIHTQTDTHTRKKYPNLVVMSTHSSGSIEALQQGSLILSAFLIYFRGIGRKFAQEFKWLFSTRVAFSIPCSSTYLSLTSGFYFTRCCLRLEKFEFSSLRCAGKREIWRDPLGVLKQVWGGSDKSGWPAESLAAFCFNEQEMCRTAFSCSVFSSLFRSLTREPPSQEQ